MERRIKSTAGQRKKLREQHVGTGFLLLKTEDSVTMEIEFHTGKNGVLCRIADGKPLFPIACFEDGKEFAIKSQTAVTTLED